MFPSRHVIQYIVCYWQNVLKFVNTPLGWEEGNVETNVQAPHQKPDPFSSQDGSVNLVEMEQVSL